MILLLEASKNQQKIQSQVHRFFTLIWLTLHLTESKSKLDLPCT